LSNATQLPHLHNQVAYLEAKPKQACYIGFVRNDGRFA
jgi:hypothetical protein